MTTPNAATLTDDQCMAICKELWPHEQFSRWTDADRIDFSDAIRAGFAAGAASVWAVPVSRVEQFIEEVHAAEGDYGIGLAITSMEKFIAALSAAPTGEEP